MKDSKKIKWATPILGMLGILLVTLILTYPMLSMETKDIPVAILSLDEGMKSPVGEVNIGNEVVKKITGGDNSLINWQKPATEAELKKGMDDSKYYASFVIPKDFTKNSAVNKSQIDVVINEGKNPMVTQILTAMFTTMGKAGDMNLNITSINKIPADFGFKALFLPVMITMITLITSLVTGFVTTISLKLKGDKKEKGKKYLIQLVYIAVLAIIIGFSATGIIVGVTGIELNFLNLALYLTTISFAVMLLVNGSINLLGTNGIAIPALMFVFGMGLIQIPYEFLPNWYQIAIASWEPLRYFGEGIRAILYQGASVINASTLVILILALIGIGLSLIVFIKKDSLVKIEQE